FKPTGQSFFVFLKNLDVIIYKAYSSQPNGSNKQKYNIDVVQVSEKQSRNQNSSHDHQASHRRCSFLLILPFQSKISHSFTYLLISDPSDDFMAKRDGNDQ